MHPARGFTLLEVLVAVGVTALLGLGIWQVMAGVIRAREGVDQIADQFEQLQRVQSWLERDLLQYAPRPVREVYGDAAPAFRVGDERFLLEMTRQGWRNPLGDPRSDLQRVAYEWVGDELFRHYWTVLDRAQDTESRTQLMLKGVTGFRVRLLDQEGEWRESWPVATGDTASDASVALLKTPRAVEVTIEHARFGAIRRLHLLPDFQPSLFQPVSGPGGPGGNEGETPQDDNASTPETPSDTSNEPPIDPASGDPVTGGEMP